MRRRVAQIAVRPAVCPDHRNMDDSRSNPPAPDRPANSAVAPLRGKRRRLQELLSTQREQIGALEAALEQQFELLRQAAAERPEAPAPAVDLAEFERQRTALAEEATSLARLSEELDRRQTELSEFESRLKRQEQSVVEQLQQQQTELDERTAELDAAGVQLRHAQRLLATTEEELAADREHAAQLRERLQEQLRAAEREREEASTRRSETNSQRRRIARELQHQRQTQKAEFDRQREALQGEREALKKDREHLAQLRAEITALQQEHELQQKALAALQQNESRADDELDQLHAELETLRSKLAEAEARVSSAPAEGDHRKHEDLKRRFELALEDLRELKQRNAELEEQLAGAKSGKSSGDSRGNEKLDWEAQKRRLLAELEADDAEDEERQEERLSIEGTIRITDEIVFRKDQEIAELKRILEEQSSNLGSVAIGAAAIAEALDQDELIRQERENLAQMQQEWRDKLKQAEIDISVERARVARERLELDEKLQWLEAERQKFTPADGKAGSKGEAGSAAQRRWWARLGLKETDENPQG